MAKRFSQTLGYEVHMGRLGRFGLDFLRGFDALLIGLDRRRTRRGGLVCDEPDFCLTDHDVGRVCRAYVAHVTPPGVPPNLQAFVHVFLRGSVNARRNCCRAVIRGSRPWPGVEVDGGFKLGRAGD
jgi:hypothetical protein